MAGSRKGERRGGARLGQHKPSFQPKTGKIRAQKLTAPENVKRQRGRPKGTGHRTLITAEKEREMIEIITGQSSEMPRDVQLECMRQLMALAREYQHMMMLALRSTPSPEMPAAKIDATVSECEGKMVQFMMLASQVSRDAAPYFHPRLAAIAVRTDRTETRDLFDVLLEEIAGQPRMNVIEHDASEVHEDEEAA